MGVRLLDAAHLPEAAFPQKKGGQPFPRENDSGRAFMFGYSGVREHRPPKTLCYAACSSSTSAGICAGMITSLAFFHAVLGSPMP